MLFTLALLGVFALVAGRLYRVSLLTATRTPLADESAMRFDAAINALRADVRGSTSIEASRPDVLVIHDSAGKTIAWQADATGELSRKSAGKVRSWNVGEPIQLRQDGAIVIVQPSRDANAAVAITNEQNPFSGGPEGRASRRYSQNARDEQ